MSIRADTTPIVAAMMSTFGMWVSRKRAMSLRRPAESSAAIESRMPRKNRTPCVSILDSA